MIELVVRSAAAGIEAALVADGRLTDYLPADEGGLGEIHLGRIRSVDPALGALLVEVERGDGWLSLEKARRLLPPSTLHEGAAVVVQITRPAIAGKGPRLAADLLLEEGDRRWHPLREAAPTGRLQALYERVREGARKQVAPALLHAPDRVERLVRHGIRLGAERLVADDHLADLKARRLLSAADGPALERQPGAWQAVADQLQEALAREVPLQGGGSLVIEPTRALTVIDVNGHGRSALEIDLEAAGEIARQLRLRRLGGIIVVDFVDLKRRGERDRLHAELCRALSSDPLPVEVLPMTRLGLVQLTRQRIGPSLDQILGRVCPSCGGEGRLFDDGSER